MRSLSTSAAFLGGLAIFVLAAPPAGADPIVPRDADGTVVVETTSADGGISGSLTVINPDPTVVRVAVKGAGTTHCTFAGATLPARSSVDVKIKSVACSLGKDGGSATLTFTGATAPPVAVVLKPKDDTKPASLGAPVLAFLLAAVGAGLLFVLLGLLRQSGDDGKKVGWGDTLPHAPADWSFKDSWASNVGAISTVFVAVFGTNDVVKALVGDASESLPGRLLIIAAFAGMLITVAPFVLKAMGPSVKTATLGGALVAGWLTTTAVAGQVLAVYTAFGVGKPTGAAWHDFVGGFSFGWPLLIVVGLLGVLVWYVIATMRDLLAPADKAAPEPSDALLAASATLVAAEVCCTSGREPGADSKLLETAYLRAVNYLAAKDATTNVTEKAKVRDPALVAGEPPPPPRYATFDEVVATRTGARGRSALI